MRRTILAALLLAPVVASAGGVGQAFDVRGKVSAGPQALLLGAPVLPAQRLVTGRDAAVKLRMLDDSIVGLGESSDVLIEQYQFDPAAPAAGSARYVLNGGSVRLVSGVMAKKRPGSVVLATPYGEVTTIGTDFVAGVCAAGCDAAPGLYVEVKSGQVQVAAPGGGTQVAGSGQVIKVSAGGSEALAAAPSFMAGLGGDPLTARFDAVEPSTLRIRVDTQDFLGGVIDPPASPSEPPRNTAGL